MIPVLTPYYDEEEINAVQDVLNYDYLNEGQRVREFEKEFARFVQAKYCVMTTSGSMALYMGLLAKKNTIPSTLPNKVPSYMGIFVAHALKQVGVYPEIIDTNEFGLSDITEKVFYVHANGRVGYALNDLPIEIEDCCQAISIHTDKAISCYSFAPTKHMTTGGQGGAVCTDDKKVYERLAGIKDHGRTERAEGKPVKDEFTKWGTNMKVTELQAGFGLAQLKKLPDRLARFNEIYKIYKDELPTIPLADPPAWQVDIMVKNPNKVIEHLKKNGVMANRLHKPIHMQPEFNKKGEYLSSEDLYKHGLFLPSTTNLTDEQVLSICALVKEC